MTGNFTIGIAKAMEAQNSLILQYLAAPEKFKPITGYSEDPHGQPVYVDQTDNVHHIQDPYNLNGWTV